MNLQWFVRTRIAITIYTSMIDLDVAHLPVLAKVLSVSISKSN